MNKSNVYQKLSDQTLFVQQQLMEGVINTEEAKKMFTILYSEYLNEEKKEIDEKSLNFVNSILFCN